MTNEDEPTKDLTEDLLPQMSDGEKLNWLVETMRQFMARNTNPLPPNYDARFAALEAKLDNVEHELTEFRAETIARLDALERAARLTNHKLQDLNENAFDLRAEHRELAARVTTLEGSPS